jgi:hypothetical protein
VSGVRRVSNPAVLERITEKSRDVLRVKATGLAAEVSAGLEAGFETRTGRTYKRKGVERVASRAGEHPAPVTKRLQNSIQALRVNGDLWEVGPVARAYEGMYPYPVALEFGFGRLKGPHSFMRTALARFKAKVLR